MMRYVPFCKACDLSLFFGPKSKQFHRWNLLFLLFLLWATPAQAFLPVAVDKANVALNGFDPVAYFTLGRPAKGSPLLRYDHEGVTWQFTNQRHLDLFKSNPAAYIPQYGGHCSLCISVGNETPFSPEAFVLRDGKLYLFQSLDVRRAWLEAPQDYTRSASLFYQRLLAEPVQGRVLIVLGMAGTAETRDTMETLPALYKSFREAGWIPGFVAPQAEPFLTSAPSSQTHDSMSLPQELLHQLRHPLSPEMVKPETISAALLLPGAGNFTRLNEHGDSLSKVLSHIYLSGGIIAAYGTGLAAFPADHLSPNLSAASTPPPTLAFAPLSEWIAKGWNPREVASLQDKLMARRFSLLTLPPESSRPLLSDRLATLAPPASPLSLADAIVQRNP